MTALLDHLKALVEDAAAGLPGVAVKTAFGSYGFFVNDQMFALAFRKEGRVGVKLPDSAAFSELMAVPGAGVWAPHKSAMGSWVLVPEGWNDDLEALRPWVRRAWELVGALPPKGARKAVKKAAAVEKPAVKKAAGKKAAVKKSAAKKAPAKKPAAKKVPAKKTGR